MSEVHFDQMRKTHARRTALRGSLLIQQSTSLREEAAFDADLVAFAPPASQTSKILASIEVVNEFMAAYVLDLVHDDWHESHEILFTVEDERPSPHADNQRAVIAEFGRIITPAANWETHALIGYASRECESPDCRADVRRSRAVGLARAFVRSRKIEAR